MWLFARFWTTYIFVAQSCKSWSKSYSKIGQNFPKYKHFISAITLRADIACFRCQKVFCLEFDALSEYTKISELAAKLEICTQVNKGERYFKPWSEILRPLVSYSVQELSTAGFESSSGKKVCFRKNSKYNWGKNHRNWKWLEWSIRTKPFSPFIAMKSPKE